MQHQDIHRIAKERRESPAGALPAHRFPSPEEIERTVADAQRLRAELIGEALRSGFRRFAGLFGSAPKPRHG